MTAPVWQRPQLAPVYAAVVALVAVVIAGWFGSLSEAQGDQAPATVAVSVTGAVPPGLTLEVDDAPGIPVDTGRPVPVPAGAQKLCLDSTEPVRVADTSSNCVHAPPVPTEISVQHVVVRVTSEQRPSGRRTASGLRVRIDGGDLPAETGTFDTTLEYRPHHPLDGRQVCLLPPIGAPDAAPLTCTTPTDRFGDVPLEVGS